MTDDKANNNERDSKENTLPPSSMGDSSPQLDSDEGEQRTKREEYPSGESGQRWGRFSWQELLSIVIILIYGVQAYFMQGQLSVMNAQLMEMRSGSADTKTVAEAARESADAAQKNVATAQAALKATIENSRLDLRAWVGATGVVKSTIEKGVPIQLEVIIQGSGKTPAVNVRIKAVWSIFAKDEFYPWCGITPSQAGASNAIIFPEQKTSVTSTPQSVDPEDITRLETGEWVLYYYGTIDYDDVFDPPTAHCTTFCYLYSRDLKMPHPCGTYNKVTDTKCEAECQAPPSVSSVLK